MRLLLAIALLLSAGWRGKAATNLLTWGNTNPPGLVGWWKLSWDSTTITLLSSVTNYSLVSTGRTTVSLVAVGTNGAVSDAVSGEVPAGPVLHFNGLFQSAPFPTGPWQTETGAVMNVTLLEDASRFYRVRGFLERP